MKKFEYYISYTFKDETGNTGFGSGVFDLDEDLDTMSASSIADCIINNADAENSKFVAVVPLFYHKRKTIEK